MSLNKKKKFPIPLNKAGGKNIITSWALTKGERKEKSNNES